MNATNLNAVFYADSYHPIQAGSIDGTDIVPHDSGVLRAVLCSAAGLYDASGDPKVIGDPYRTLFVGRLSRQTNEETLRMAMSAYGRVKNTRLVRDIVTGASRGYAFVEYEAERHMRRAYMDAHHSIIDNTEVIVDYNRQQLMPGWIPRRLGGGLGGKKESGQLRFGGRERPFRAPLRPIPYDDLKRLGIPLPPEGRFSSRFHVPSPPRSGSHKGREDSPATFSDDREDTPLRGSGSRVAKSREDSGLRYRRTDEKEELTSKWSENAQHSRQRISDDREENTPTKWTRSYSMREEPSHQRKRYVEKEDCATTGRRKRRSPSSGGDDSARKPHRDSSERSHRHQK